MSGVWGRALVVALSCLVPYIGIASAAHAEAARQGSFEVVTYNVAGLPEGLSGSHPVANLPLIGQLLNKYDIALVQEDFAYPEQLRRNVRHGHVSPAFVRSGLDFGDGLSEFSRLPFSAFRRVPWQSCHGLVDSFFDCWTPKGYTVAHQWLAEGVSVDVYNLHMDAGWSSEDKQARDAQVSQLVTAILRDSAGRALIVGGDTNILRRDGQLERLLADTELADACSRLHCSQPWRVDRVLYRSSPELRLEARAWRIDNDFIDAQGHPLSDHMPVAVAFEWQAQPALARSAAAQAPQLRRR
jgi:exonuclease III